MELNYERWYECCKLLLNYGFDLEKNSAGDLLGAINEVYDHYDEYFNSEVNS